MGFNISPSVAVQEQDLTLNPVLESDFIGATAGYAQWGPASKPFLITGGVDELEATFYKPNDATYLDFLTASDFLSYSPKMWFTRVVGPAARNAVEGGNNPVLVKNSDEQETGTFTGTQWLAKYPGSLGNGIVIDVADSAKFAGWEFRGAFDYPPAAGEYAVAVVDSTGAFGSAGSGETKQTERLTVYNQALGGTQERRTLTISGVAAGGVKQVEELYVTGALTASTSLVVDGVTVAVVAGDSTTTIAGKIATALAAITANYTSAVATGDRVTVTFKNVGLRNKISTLTQDGVTVTSTINVLGDDTVALTVYGRTFNVKNGDAAAVVAGVLATQLGYMKSVFSTVTVAAAVVTVTYLSYGVQTYPITVQVSNGVTTTSAITVVGADTITASVFGVNVTLKSGDTPTIVANKISTALAADATFQLTFDSIQSDRSSVLYRSKVVGQRTTQTPPVSQFNLSFGVDVVVAGKLGSIIEKYEILSTDVNAKFPDGTTRYFYDAINRSSKYIFVGDKTQTLQSELIKLSGGVDDYSVNRVAAILEYSNDEQINLNYIWVAGSVIEQKAVGDVIETRRDCIATFSPMLSDVVNNKGNEMAAVIDWRSVKLNRDTTYGVNTDNWGLIYDKYNDVNRWIPTCGGVAGLMARTAEDVDPWISPAGHQRGRMKNYIRLAWSAKKPQRDELYKVGVNPIVDFPAEGFLLYGDKTSTSRPTAFSRINVRAAFIVAEKSIANFAKQYLFEINDSFTRGQFLNAVRPFLRNMVARKAFSETKVIADETNNTGATVANNEMNGKILLKPMYSINFINLKFAAAGPNVLFDEIEA